MHAVRLTPHAAVCQNERDCGEHKNVTLTADASVKHMLRLMVT